MWLCIVYIRSTALVWIYIHICVWIGMYTTSQCLSKWTKGGELPTLGWDPTRGGGGQFESGRTRPNSALYLLGCWNVGCIVNYFQATVDKWVPPFLASSFALGQNTVQNTNVAALAITLMPLPRPCLLLLPNFLKKIVLFQAKCDHFFIFKYKQVPGNNQSHSLIILAKSIMTRL